MLWEKHNLVKYVDDQEINQTSTTNQHEIIQKSFPGTRALGPHDFC